MADCQHTKTLITIDTGDGIEEKCIICDDIETLTLDEDSTVVDMGDDDIETSTQDE